MKISSAALELKAQSTRTQVYSKTESLEMIMQSTGQDAAGESGSPAAVLELSDAFAAQQTVSKAECIAEAKPDPFALSDADKLKLKLVQKLLEAFTGKKIRFVVPDRSSRSDNAISVPQAPGRETVSSQGAGFGAIYSSSETYYESEQLSFSAAGFVETADGRTISLDLTLNMSREFYASSATELRIGSAAVDPLVMNFGAPAASLTDTKFAFDLDSDGDFEQISFVGVGSGFLALDLNEDGVVNNGKELFGPSSGDGFADLSALDGDGNGWIDENDPIYDKLRIWTKDENGNDTLLALGKKGVGAIFLGNVSTEYALKNPVNRQNGEIRKSGVFLFENGGAGTLQHVDLTV